LAAINLRSGPVTVAAGGGGPSREEAVMRMVMQAMGRREFLDEVTEYEPGRRIAHRSVGGRADGDPHGLPG
jgi:hypothetical protein